MYWSLLCQEVYKTITYSFSSSTIPARKVDGDSLAKMKKSEGYAIFLGSDLYHMSGGWFWIQAESEAHNILSCTLSSAKHVTHAVWGT